MDNGHHAFPGVCGIGLLMFLENSIPSELIMPLAGFTVGQGKMQFAPVVAAGVGYGAGSMPWYYAGKLLGEALAAANRW